MKVGKWVLKFLRSHKNITNVLAATSLIGIEEILELGFKCPPSKAMRNAYITVYFVLPALILWILAGCVEVRVFKLPCDCQVFWKAFLAAVIWTVILFLDGDYLQCACKVHAANETTEGLKEEDFYVLSQIIGLAIASITVVVTVIASWCCCSGSPGDKIDSSLPLEVQERPSSPQ